MSRGAAAAKAQATDGRRQHQEWLDLTEVSGPFLTMPVLLRAWPQLDALEKDERARLRAWHADWQTDTTAGRDEWVAYVLGRLLEWGDALVFRQGESEHDGLDRLTLRVAEHNTEVRPDFALVEPGTDLAAEPDAESAAKRVRLLGMTVPAGTAPTARVGGGGDWSAAPADRLARLLRHHGVPLGLVTDGRWWCLVWAPLGGVTTTAVFDAIGWNEAAERNVVRAFVSLLRRRRFFEYDDAETLVGLLKASLAAGEDVTEALGVQVRQAVELLVDAIGRADVRAVEHGAPGLHASGVSAGEVYRGAVAVMMRIVFLLFAEERGLLPADNEVYARSYSARFLRDELKARADEEGETSLEHTTSAWHRLIALFHAVHGGVDHPGSGFHLPAYDGSIFDPDKYPWLERTTPLLPIDDRTVLHMLQAVQEVRVGKGKDREVRTLSFRALDVEQIGYVYEGLLSYDGRRATEHMVGLIGPEGLEHEVPLRELEALAAKAGGSPKTLAKSIHEKWKDPKPPAFAARASSSRSGTSCSRPSGRGGRGRGAPPAERGDEGPGAHGAAAAVRRHHPGGPAGPADGHPERRAVRDGVLPEEEHGHALHAPLPRGGGRPARAGAAGVRAGSAADGEHGGVAAEVLRADPRPEGRGHRDGLGGVPGGGLPLPGGPPDRGVGVRGPRGRDDVPRGAGRGRGDRGGRGAGPGGRRGAAPDHRALPVRRRHQPHGRGDGQAVAVAGVDGPGATVHVLGRPAGVRGLVARCAQHGADPVRAHEAAGAD
jgi:hypothetical protein